MPVPTKPFTAIEKIEGFLNLCHKNEDPNSILKKFRKSVDYHNYLRFAEIRMATETHHAKGIYSKYIIKHIRNYLRIESMKFRRTNSVLCFKKKIPAFMINYSASEKFENLDYDQFIQQQENNLEVIKETLEGLAAINWLLDEMEENVPKIPNGHAAKIVCMGCIDSINTVKNMMIVTEFMPEEVEEESLIY